MDWLLDLLDITMPDQAGPVDGVSLLPLIDGKMKSRPTPIPLVDGGKTRLVDNEYRFQKGRLFRFDEEQKKDVDVTDKHPEEYRRLMEWVDEWRQSVRKDQRCVQGNAVTPHTRQSQASEYKLEAQASGSVKDPKQRETPDPLACVACLYGSLFVTRSVL